MQRLDFWRAIGVAFGTIAVASVIWALTIPLLNISLALFLLKEVVATVAIAVGATWLYFWNGPRPSATTGAWFGFAVLLGPVIWGLVDLINGVTAPASIWPPEQYLLGYTIGSAVLIFGLSIATGWYLGKNKVN